MAVRGALPKGARKADREPDFGRIVPRGPEGDVVRRPVAVSTLDYGDAIQFDKDDLAVNADFYDHIIGQLGDEGLTFRQVQAGAPSKW